MKTVLLNKRCLSPLCLMLLSSRHTIHIMVGKLYYESSKSKLVGVIVASNVLISLKSVQTTHTLSVACVVVHLLAPRGARQVTTSVPLHKGH